MAKEVFAAMIASGESAAAVVERSGMRQIHDAGALLAVVERVLAAHAAEVEKYRAGKTNLFGFFVGQVMKETRGQGNPVEVNRFLREKSGLINDRRERAAEARSPNRNGRLAGEGQRQPSLPRDRRPSNCV